MMRKRVAYTCKKGLKFRNKCVAYAIIAKMSKEKQEHSVKSFNYGKRC